jgi:hypothetical protein
MQLDLSRPFACGAMFVFLTALAGCGPTPLPGPGPGGAALPTWQTSLPDVHSCPAGVTYHLVGVQLRTGRGQVDGGADRVVVSVPRSALIIQRFHAAVGCTQTLGPGEGGPASAAFDLTYTGDLRREPDGSTCVTRSRADYANFRSDGFAAAAIVVEPQIREQVWRGFDDFAIERATGVARPSTAPGPRCSDWVSL